MTWKYLTNRSWHFALQSQRLKASGVPCLYFKKGVFIEKLKITQIAPVHKKSEIQLCYNYRPTHLLSHLANS